MSTPFPVLTLRRLELTWVLEQCGASAWPYPLAAAVWPADREDETVLARARAEDALRARGLLEPGPAAVLLAVGAAVRDRTRQVDLVRRSATTPCAAVALGSATDAALLWSADHADADVAVRRLDPEGLVAGLLALVPPLAPAVGPALEVPAIPGVPAGPGTVRGERERRAVEDVLTAAEAWTQIGAVPAPNGLTSVRERVDATIKWLDGPRGRYRLRHDPGHTHDAGPGRTSRGRARLVGEDATSPAVRAELEAALGPLDRGRSTV
ncbi:ESX secretion-associated protein EspG [Actinomycetospora endophytica]|uniref:ESX secretion-associated protein EspG n=1 Tax=Actinomycetospora endophytica TaxID=2291215 RepID=A0ABS8P6U1_9PSEU|nr:ESX secretion-associated protein EspG [Actinomycetospora endophytica]MCD2193265.1 ESX secretion-associated protein EspG [Actinomycetospora endophytica]